MSGWLFWPAFLVMVAFIASRRFDLALWWTAAVFGLAIAVRGIE